jgi:hypothetical protein
MKTQNLLGGRSRVFMLSLIAGLLFSFNGYSQDGGEKDCACVKKIQNGPVITFLNVSEYSETNDSYTMLTDCKDGDSCDGECTWAYKKPHVGWIIEHGECVEWPGVVPVDGKSNPYTYTEVVPDKQQVFEFYPNPASGSVNIKSESESVTTIIYDVTGAELLRTNEKTMDISKLSPGTYIITMTDGYFLQREQLVVQ